MFIKAVADWLGHASPTVTLNTYAHLMPADDDLARGLLDTAFSETADFSADCGGYDCLTTVVAQRWRL